MRVIFAAAQLSAALLSAPAAFAQTNANSVDSNLTYECNLSGGTGGAGLAGCPNDPDPTGKLTTKAVTGVVTGNNNVANITCSTASASVPPYCATRSDPPALAVAPIDAWGTCRWVDNSGSDALFVPFRTDFEWQAFLTAATPPHGLTGIGITPCAEPQSETHVASPVSTVPTYDSTCAGVMSSDGTMAVPNVYGRAGAYGNAMTSLYPATPASQNFLCHGGTTNISSQLQWYAGNVNWVSKFVYSPDLVLTATPSSTSSTPVPAGTAVALNWGTDGTATSCKAGGGTANDGWNGGNWVRPLPMVNEMTNVVVSPNVTTTYTVSCTGTNGLISTASATVYIGQTVNGVCGATVNGQNLSSAPSGAELCDKGTPSAVAGGTTGPWTWTCQGSGGGMDSGTCTANKVFQVCPVAVASGYPLFGYPTGINIQFPGYSSGTFLTPTSASSGVSESGNLWGQGSYFNGACTSAMIVYPNSTNTVTTTLSNGQTEFSSGTYMSDTSYEKLSAYYDFVNCVAQQYAQQSVSGYANCTPSSWSGNVVSPLKVNLVGQDAKMNSTTPTAFLLTLKDGRILESHVKGGLNADEGWLMVHRSKAPLVYDNGALNADNWFGDRDHRSLNGYTDLAETFAAFVTKDQYGQRYLPLHILTDAEKSQGTADPSFDLRIIDASNAEHFASDYFDRIYVNYRNVVEGDAPDGKSGDNIILERGMVHTLKGENHGAVDQWFVLDIPADYSDPGPPTQSKVWPAPAAAMQ